MWNIDIVFQRLNADVDQKLASKAFKCQVDVYRPFCFNVFNNTDRAPSNIWAPEQQKQVVEVRSDLPTARYIIDPVSRHWQNIIISRLGFVVSCALTILRMSRWPRRPIMVASSRDAGNPI